MNRSPLPPKTPSLYRKIIEKLIPLSSKPPLLSPQRSRYKKRRKISVLLY